MPLEAVNPSDLDRIGVLARGTGSNVAGEVVLTYTNLYTDVRAKKLNPLRTSGNEGLESRQDVASQEVSWLIRRENRIIDSKNTVFISDGETYSVTQVRDYKGSRNWVVLDTIWKDNVSVSV